MIGFPPFNKSARNVNLLSHAIVEAAPAITVLGNVSRATGFGVNVCDVALRLSDNGLLLQRKNGCVGVSPVGLNSKLATRNNELSKC